jgi:hypothetical protein
MGSSKVVCLAGFRPSFRNGRLLREKQKVYPRKSLLKRQTTKASLKNVKLKIKNENERISK